MQHWNRVRVWIGFYVLFVLWMAVSTTDNGTRFRLPPWDFCRARIILQGKVTRKGKEFMKGKLAARSGLKGDDERRDNGEGNVALKGKAGGRWKSSNDGLGKETERNSLKEREGWKERKVG
jgi:hypothetical protein